MKQILPYHVVCITSVSLASFKYLQHRTPENVTRNFTLIISAPSSEKGCVDAHN